MSMRVLAVRYGSKRSVIAAGMRGRKGEQGEDGAAFQVDASGLLANRGAFDGEGEGFSYLATDTGDLYFRQGSAGNWSDPVPFQGPAGDSAYQIAVNNGFVGTEAEWLEALAGADGTNGTDGSNGVDGVGITSATINGSGHLLLTLSNSTVLDAGYVVGPAGTDGVDGTDGTNGVDGADGVDGRSITGASVNGSGHLILTFSDSTQADVGLVVGADGLNGSDGTDGAPGADGANGADGAPGVDGSDGRGIASMAIDGSNHLIITYTDTTTEDAGVIPGAGGAAAWGAIGGTLTDQTDLVAALAEKVDTETGKGLSSNDYTTTEQTKLSGIEAGAQVNAAAVSQAEAEAGTGTALRSWTVQRVWQAIAAWWAASAMKTKLDGIATGATANSTDVELRDRSTHTGTQPASTISDFSAAASAAAPVQSVNSQTGTVVLDAGDVGADAAGTAASAVVAHEALADPHPQYLTQTEGDARYERGLTAGTNVTIDRTDPGNPVINVSGGGGGGGAVDSVNGQTGVVVLDAGDVGAEYPLTAGANISIDRTDPENPVISASGSGTGVDPESVEASEALSAGHYLNLFNDGGTLKARKAGGSGKYPAHGFVKAAVSAAATASVYPLSMANDALSGLTNGTTYFLSTSTEGAVQATAPNSSGVLRQELGVAISATKIIHTNSLPVELV